MSDTVPTVLLGLVSELAGVLHEEAGLADELVGAPWRDLARGLPALVVVAGLLFVLILFHILDDEAFLQDDIEARFDVIALLFVIVLFLFGLRCGSARIGAPRGRSGFLCGIAALAPFLCRVGVIIAYGFEVFLYAFFQEALVLGELLVLRAAAFFKFFIFEFVSHVVLPFGGQSGGSIDRR
jgi:hypothetical protein